MMSFINECMSYDKARMGNDKKKCIAVIAAVLLCSLLTSCSSGNTGQELNYVNKSNSQVEQDIAAYLKEKYDREFTVAVSDRPNHLYSSYEATAYDEKQNDFDVSITYYDEEIFSVSESYLLYGLKDDFEAWFTELADPYIDSEFKVFFIPISGLPSEYQECKTVEEFLEMSPTGTYYGLKYQLLLPASEYNSDIRMILDAISQRMLELKIRGQISITIYEEEDIFEKTLTNADRRFFQARHYRHRYCYSTVKGNFSIETYDEILEYGISGYRKELDDYVGGKS